MIKTLIPLLALVSASAWADGNLADQAANAVKASMELLENSVQRTALRGFKSVYAEHVAHETYAVTSTFTDGKTLVHLCKEDESVRPVIWRCEAQ